MYRELDSSRSSLRTSSNAEKRIRLKNYWVEILTLLVILSGVFLAIEPIPFQQLFTSMWMVAVDVPSMTAAWLAGALDRITLTNYAGGVVALLAGMFIIKRIHQRIFSSMRSSAVQCPHCTGPLSRIHRTKIDHLLGAFLHLRLLRFYCRHCGWAGRRVG